ncbi:MAG: DUF6463 family protein [Pseudomonadota bacterium]|nr:DUF6463 family protein [Pseudomonadota bacterium]
MNSKRWIGRWIIAVSALHTLFGLLAFAPVLQAMLSAGLWNSVGPDAMRGSAAWFLISGGFMLVFGLAVDACERGNGDRPLRAIGWSLLIVTLVVIVVMPVSGAWLLLPPAIAMMRRGNRG